MCTGILDLGWRGRNSMRHVATSHNNNYLSPPPPPCFTRFWCFLTYPRGRVFSDAFINTALSLESSGFKKINSQH